MATIAAELRPARLALLVAFIACVRPELEAPAPATDSAARAAEPLVRVGLATAAPQVTLGGDAALRVLAADGGTAARIGAGEQRVAVPATGGITLRGLPLRAMPRLILAADGDATVRVNGRDYRGRVELLRSREGITVVSQLPMERYLESVVSSEMGRRAPEELSALKAQAVVARTYAVRNLGRWAADGFDLQAGEADQVYGGAGAESELGRQAVAETRGEIVTWQGAPIEAFFHSTCGGRTAQGREVFRGADRPYLRSVSDVADDGRAWCAASPRFRWQEEWDATSLREALRRSLPSQGVTAAAAADVRDLRVARRTASGRIGVLEIVLRGRTVAVDAPQVRQVLRTVAGDPLRSSAADLAVERGGGRVTRLVATGSGAGHGVGFCQWGAIGRARAGQGYRAILAAYYPGTALARRY